MIADSSNWDPNFGAKHNSSNLLSGYFVETGYNRNRFLATDSYV